MTRSKYVGAIDAGGTTFKCGILVPGEEPVAYTRIKTTTPGETIHKCVQWYKEQAELGMHIEKLGVASFGPVDRDPVSQTYGIIFSTPKPSWSQTNLLSALSQALNVDVSLDTDVNAALLAEMRWGAGRGVVSCAYVTIGTGIGAGLFANGSLIGAPLHPEFGHIRVQRHPEDQYSGGCSFHNDCLEGLASAKALTERFGDTTELRADHIGWKMMSFYLAQACSAISLMIRPERVILGGGLMQAPHLLDMVRKDYHSLQADYLNETTDNISKLIVTPQLGDDAGLQGAAFLAT